MVNIVHQLWIVSGKATAPFSLSWRDKLATERSSASDAELFRTFLRLSRCQQSQNLFHAVFPGAGSAQVRTGKRKEATLDPLKRACLFIPDLASDRGSAGGVDNVVSSESFQELQVLLHIHIVFFPDRGNWCDILNFC